MRLSTQLDRLHLEARQNRWLQYFTVFVRIALAAGFLPSGLVKIMGERFTSLSVNHPMGNYLEALHHTGYYYTFIGFAQVMAAILLLIPRTVLLGAVLYFPIILNICILSLAVRFDGSLLTSPLMVLANLYLLCWHYDRLKYIFPVELPAVSGQVPQKSAMSNKFPIAFFGGVFATVVMVALLIFTVFEIKPFNTIGDCQQKCKDSANPEACATFCDCIHNQGKPLNTCLTEYNKTVAARAQPR
ncbi:DoxX family protein [uncultured Fibrella sp.]|uniref:DoxX family protein n=1 Tax=uncultured Fibrella sp. TaxID=1284596 RepID=UPI0035CBBA16